MSRLVGYRPGDMAAAGLSPPAGRNSLLGYRLAQVWPLARRIGEVAALDAPFDFVVKWDAIELARVIATDAILAGQTVDEAHVAAMLAVVKSRPAKPLKRAWWRLW